VTENKPIAGSHLFLSLVELLILQRQPACFCSGRDKFGSGIDSSNNLSKAIALDQTNEVHTMQKFRTSFFRTILLGLFVSFSASANDKKSDLKIVTGEIRLSNHDGIPCLFEKQLIEESRKRALESLGDPENFQQVSPWAETKFLDYYLVVTSKASFERKNGGSDPVQVRTEGRAECYYNDQPFEKAYQAALKQARFYCNGEVILPPSNIAKRTESDDWGDRPTYPSQWAIYKATFQCVRGDTTRHRESAPSWWDPNILTS
jgi:hypothetical protein